MGPCTQVQGRGRVHRDTAPILGSCTGMQGETRASSHPSAPPPPPPLPLLPLPPSASPPPTPHPPTPTQPTTTTTRRFTQVELFWLTLCEAPSVGASRTRWWLRSTEAGAASPFVVATRTVDGRGGCSRGDAPLLTRTEACHSHKGGGGARHVRSATATATEDSSTWGAARHPCCRTRRCRRPRS